jgi:hypothetical protein
MLPMALTLFAEKKTNIFVNYLKIRKNNQEDANHISKPTVN